MNHYDIQNKPHFYEPREFYGVFPGRTVTEALASLFYESGHKDIEYCPINDEITYPNGLDEATLGTIEDYQFIKIKTL
jgi:hypothetical protein